MGGREGALLAALAGRVRALGCGAALRRWQKESSSVRPLPRRSQQRIRRAVVLTRLDVGLGSRCRRRSVQGCCAARRGPRPAWPGLPRRVVFDQPPLRHSWPPAWAPPARRGGSSTLPAQALPVRQARLLRPPHARECGALVARTSRRAAAQAGGAAARHSSIASATTPRHGTCTALRRAPPSSDAATTFVPPLEHLRAAKNCPSPQLSRRGRAVRKIDLWRAQPLNARAERTSRASWGSSLCPPRSCEILFASP